MVHDDDNPIGAWKISPNDEPLTFTRVDDVQIRDAILDLARDHPQWGRLTIHTALLNRGFDIEESAVNYVLHQYRMPNLHL